MPNPEWVVNAFEVHNNYVLRLWFEDGSVKDFDCHTLLNEKPFVPLQDKAFFSQAHVFADTVAWSEEIDIAQEYLYEHGKNVIDWAEFVSKDGDDIRDGMSPEDYVRRLRNLDR